MPQFQRVPSFDMNGTFNEMAFQTFSEEALADIFNMIDKSIEYSGMLHNGKLEGKGTLYDKETGNFFCGNFHNQQKDGFGMLWFGEKSTAQPMFD
mmetsp:Transcript_5894/g.9558  ORF Transcript_5894/g.9558 Transcript_5894/m.9558 type:complete len:95 (+) Transcript_5894:1846-2130(+)